MIATYTLLLCSIARVALVMSHGVLETEGLAPLPVNWTPGRSFSELLVILVDVSDKKALDTVWEVASAQIMSRFEGSWSSSKEEWVGSNQPFTVAYIGHDATFNYMSAHAEDQNKENTYENIVLGKG